ncbi:MAG: hypothetical protein ACXW1O_05325, partial [Halobacteriota archaeon]
PSPEQWNAIGIMSREIPPERYPEAIAWLFPLIEQDDRENIVRAWQMGMPESVFAGVKELIKKAIPSDWADLTERIPNL